jgi:hypothetical protein
MIVQGSGTSGSDFPPDFIFTRLTNDFSQSIDLMDEKSGALIP